MTAAALAIRAKESREWLLDAAFPFWLDRGQDSANGGFHERLNRDGSAVDTPKRLRVQARQIYSCAEAARMGWTGPWRDRLETTLNLLLTKGRRSDGLFIHQFDVASQPLDQRADLYDQAFVLFALAHASQALSRPDLMDEAEKLWSTIEQNWARPSGGFAEGEVEPAHRRRQNPHMHLFEASMACVAASPNAGVKARMLKRAENLQALFAAHFFDAKQNVVREFFDETWNPATGDEGNTWEPGHSFEWVWLLSTWHRVTGQDNTAIEQALSAHASAQGINAAHNVAIDEAWISGGTKSAGARLWPQTERLKATLTAFEKDPTSTHESECLIAFDGLWQYLSADGFWADRMKADGTLIQESAPASSLYHILVAFSELARIARL